MPKGAEKESGNKTQKILKAKTLKGSGALQNIAETDTRSADIIALEKTKIIPSRVALDNRKTDKAIQLIANSNHALVSDCKNVIYSIGHSDYDIDVFISTLIEANVEHVFDIRSSPNTARCKDYRHDKLKTSLQRTGINYTHMPELGGKHGIPISSKKHPIHDAISSTNGLIALDEICRISSFHPVSIMCSEKCVHDCHRKIVSKRLNEMGHVTSELTVNRTVSSVEAKDNIRRKKYMPSMKFVSSLLNNHDPDSQVDENINVWGQAYSTVVNDGPTPLTLQKFGSQMFVYREIGLQNALAEVGEEKGLKAINAEIDKYFGSRSLSQPLDKRKLADADIVFVAKLLFGLKFSELPTDLQKAKARLVIGGHLGYNKTGRVVFRGKRDKSNTEDYWTPTSPLSTLRLLVSYASCKQWKISSIDLKQAYLQTLLGATNYFVALPSNVFPFLPKDIQTQISKLNIDDKFIVFRAVSSLYGLPRAGYDYISELHRYLQQRQWLPLPDDPAAFYKTYDGFNVILITYVDDLMLACPHGKEDAIWQDILGEYWQADPVESVAKDVFIRYLGINIHDDGSSGFILEQSEYGRNIITSYEARHNIKIMPRITLPKFEDDIFSPSNVDIHHNCDDTIIDHLHAPGVTSLAHANAPVQIPTADSKGAHSTIGSLMYLCRGTRADLQYAIQRAAERVHCWSEAEEIYLVHLLGFILKVDFRLHYPAVNNSKPRLIGYTDSNYASPCSRSGLAVCIQLLATSEVSQHLIDWSSKKQSYVALSSGQAETVALTSAVKLIDGHHRNWKVLYSISDAPDLHGFYIVFTDASTAVAAVRRGWSRVLSNVNRAVGVAITWLHDKALSTMLRVCYLPGTINPADALTKSLPLVSNCLRYLMQWKIEGHEKPDNAENIRTTKDGWQQMIASSLPFQAVPPTVQPLTGDHQQSCWLCGNIARLCRKCKYCDDCGCECNPVKHDDAIMGAHGVTQ